MLVVIRCTQNALSQGNTLSLPFGIGRRDLFMKPDGGTRIVLGLMYLSFTNSLKRRVKMQLKSLILILNK
jgi:hypothetical protein